MARPVIFVDIDGPLLSTRSSMLPENRRSAVPTRRDRFDPCAVAILETVAQESDAHYVISSSWAVMGRDRLIPILDENGLDMGRLHHDWETPKVTFGHRDREIRGWLDKHPDVTRWTAVDDMRCDPKLVPNWVPVAFEEGLTYSNMLLMKFHLGLLDQNKYDFLKRLTDPNRDDPMLLALDPAAMGVV